MQDWFSSARTSLREDKLTEVLRERAWQPEKRRRAPSSADADGMGNVTNDETRADYDAFATPTPPVVEVARLELDEAAPP